MHLLGDCFGIDARIFEKEFPFSRGGGGGGGGVLIRQMRQFFRRVRVSRIKLFSRFSFSSFILAGAPLIPPLAEITLQIRGGEASWAIPTVNLTSR